MDIMTGISVIVLFIGLIVVVIVEKVTNSKERVELEKIRKVKDVADYGYLFPEADKEQEVEEENNTVSLDNLTEDIIRGKI